MPAHWNLEVIDLNVVSPPGRTLRMKIAEADAVTGFRASSLFALSNPR
jgi:hypothetical protein